MTPARAEADPVGVEGDLVRPASHGPRSVASLADAASGNVSPTAARQLRATARPLVVAVAVLALVVALLALLIVAALVVGLLASGLLVDLGGGQSALPSPPSGRACPLRAHCRPTTA